jgi:crotonobetainyl-CoA:carnitine CoA-transferase CaiB-like acyl-CoA transferase
MIGQAFGFDASDWVSDPEPPVRANPWTADYITALFCLWSSLAGYISAQRTGKGQVIDISQFESIHHLLSGTMVEYFADGFVRQRSGNKATAFQPYDAFQASDGWVVIGAVGYSVFSRVCSVLGLDPNEENGNRLHRCHLYRRRRVCALLRGWVAERTVGEVVETMNAAQMACCPIMHSRDIAEDAHYKARGVHSEWEDGQVGKVKGTGVSPLFSATPGKIWRGSVPVGHDNEQVYAHFAGLSHAEIAQLQERE